MGNLSGTVPTSDNRPKRKCPYCAEEILTDAVICRFCGREVNQTDESAKRKAIKLVMQKQLDELEKWINTNDRYIQEQMEIVRNANSSTTWGWVIFILGLILAPVLVGIVICIVSLINVNKNSKLKNDANAAILNARNNEEKVKNRIIELKSSIRKYD
jgi:hypothetical protein